jgi:hypothetical protein
MMVCISTLRPTHGIAFCMRHTRVGGWSIKCGRLRSKRGFVPTAAAPKNNMCICNVINMLLRASVITHGAWNSYDISYITYVCGDEMLQLSSITICLQCPGLDFCKVFEGLGLDFCKVFDGPGLHFARFSRARAPHHQPPTSIPHPPPSLPFFWWVERGCIREATEQGGTVDALPLLWRVGGIRRDCFHNMCGAAPRGFRVYPNSSLCKLSVLVVSPYCRCFIFYLHTHVYTHPQ